MFWKFTLAFVLTNLWSYFGKEIRDLRLCCGRFVHGEILTLEVGQNRTNSMLHNGLLDLMNRSTCFGHYYAHHQELATIQMVSAYGSSPSLWQVAGLVHGCRSLERPVRVVKHPSGAWL